MHRQQFASKQAFPQIPVWHSSLCRSNRLQAVAQGQSGVDCQLFDLQLAVAQETFGQEAFGVDCPLSDLQQAVGQENLGVDFAVSGLALEFAMEHEFVE